MRNARPWSLGLILLLGAPMARAGLVSDSQGTFAGLTNLTGRNPATATAAAEQALAQASSARTLTGGRLQPAAFRMQAVGGGAIWMGAVLATGSSPNRTIASVLTAPEVEPQPRRSAALISLIGIPISPFNLAVCHHDWLFLGRVVTDQVVDPSLNLLSSQGSVSSEPSPTASAVATVNRQWRNQHPPLVSFRTLGDMTRPTTRGRDSVRAALGSVNRRRIADTDPGN